VSYRAEIAQMLRKMPSGWRRQYQIGRDTLARNGGPVLPDVPTPEQAMLIIANTAGGNPDTDTPRGDQPVPTEVRDAAMKGLRLSYRNNYGGWEFFGIARAIQLALVPAVPMRTRERMVRYLSDHAKDKAGTNFGNDQKPSRGYMAWLNWGGDPAVAWNDRDGIGRASYGAAAKRKNGGTVLYHGGATPVLSPRAGAFLTPEKETARTYALYGPNQMRRVPEPGVVSSYVLREDAVVQKFDSFSAAYAHYKARSTRELAARAEKLREADIVAVYDEYILVDPSVVVFLSSEDVFPARKNGAGTSVATRVGAKLGLKSAAKFVPVVGEAVMAYDVTREGRKLYRERKGGKKHSLREAGARLAGSAFVGSEGVEWAQKKLEARKAKNNPRYTSAVRTDPELWEEVKAEVTRGSRGGLPGQWSARKAQMAVALYQDRGGGYVGPKSPRNALAKWTREQWRTKSGRPSLETGERYLPAAAIAALTPAEYAATTRAKRAGMRKGEQFVPQPTRVAEKVKRYRRNPMSDEQLLRVTCVGMCGEFAVALHREFGYPLGAFYEVGPDGWEEGDYTLAHAFAYHPSGKLVDSKGVRSRASMKRELLTGGGKIKEQRVSAADLDALSMEGLDEEVLAASRDYIRRNRSVFA